MAKNRPSLRAPRTKAFKKQQGRCYYCDLPMWISDAKIFSQRYKLTLKQAEQFKCTGEHLTAFHARGASNQSNIVAACHYCNAKRHARKEELSPKTYKKKVQKRVRAGKWNAGLLLSAH